MEPAEYFTPEMLKVAEEWERKHANDITYKEALMIAKGRKEKINTCAEHENAYVFGTPEEAKDSYMQLLKIMNDGMEIARRFLLL